MQTVCNTYRDAGKGNLTAQNTRKPFGGRGSAPDPAEGAYSAPANPLVGRGAGCPLLKNPIPRSRTFGPHLFYPHSKITSDAVECRAMPFGLYASPTGPLSPPPRQPLSPDLILLLAPRSVYFARLSNWVLKKLGFKV